MAEIIIADTSPRVQYTVTDATTGPFAIPFPYFEDADIKVYFGETLKEITTHYTISGTAVDDGFSGGNVTSGASISSTTVTIVRDIPIARTTDHAPGLFNIATLNKELDKLFAINQYLETQLTGVVKRPDTSTESYSLSWPDGATSSTQQIVVDTTNGITFSADTGTVWLGGNGAVGAPYYSFASDPNSGFYRIGADNVGLSLGGTKRVDFATAGTSITGTLTTSGILSVDDTTVSSSATTGSIHTDGGVGIAKQLFVGGVATHGDDIVSDTDSTDDLGTTGVRWANLYVDAITTTNNQTIGGNLEVTGNLTINGTTVTNDATNTEVKDPLIELNSGASSNASDLGIIMERGSTGNNAVILWDESGDFFTVGTTTATADSTGNMTYAFAPFKCSALTATSGTLAGLTSIGMSAGATLTAGFLDEDDMASDSAVAGVTQQSVKAYSDANAPENGVKFAFESTTTDTDQGAGKIFLNHGTPSSATVLYVDDVEAGGVSVNAWVDTWDDVTNAVARGYVYIAKYGSTNALLVYKVTGAVTSASTYSKVAVSHVLTVGSFSDGDSVGLTFIPSGADGSGDLSSANNLSDVASATTSATNLGLGTGSSPQFTGVELGHATDTTITRASGGDLNIEGNIIYRAGGTDVPIADGGTGASTVAAAKVALELDPFLGQLTGKALVFGL